MFSRFTTCLILAAITLQGVFGGLRGNVVICLGGGHVHEQTEVVEHCDQECTHHGDWPTPTTSDGHLEDCECTDVELDLIALLSTPRVTDQGHDFASPPVAFIQPIWQIPPHAQWRGPPPNRMDDPGGRHRITVIRSTRLLL